jgi:uncharacterized protein (TIGR02594 family)
MTPFELAQRYAGIGEFAGGKDHPLIQWWLSLCGLGFESPDETPWCSAFVNGIAWELRLARSKSAAARSWLAVGTPVSFADAAVGFDVVIIKRDANGHDMMSQPGPEVLNAPGHVGFYAGREPGRVLLFAGNQGNRVSLASFSEQAVLGVRRIN